MKIIINKLIKKYNGLKALNNFSCTLEGGKIYGLVGSNGAGKTTLLKIISTLLSAEEGNIEYLDIKKDNVNYIPEHPDLFFMLTVREHYKFISLAHGIKGWEEKTSDLLKRFSLIDKIDAFPHELSKGMKQKLILSLSLLVRPRVILFDEPFAGLDPQSVNELRILIEELRDKNRIIVISSHNLNSIYQLSDQVIFIKDGKRLRTQSKEDIISEMKSKDYIALEDLFLEVMAHENN